MREFLLITGRAVSDKSTEEGTVGGGEGRWGWEVVKEEEKEEEEKKKEEEKEEEKEVEEGRRRSKRRRMGTGELFCWNSQELEC